MTIHPVQTADTARSSAAAVDSTAYDSVWSGRSNPTAEVPIETQASAPLERVMLSNEKIYVVLAVVLIIWFGLAFLIFRTDRKLDRVERALDAGGLERDD